MKKLYFILLSTLLLLVACSSEDTGEIQLASEPIEEENEDIKQDDTEEEISETVEDSNVNTEEEISEEPIENTETVTPLTEEEVKELIEYTSLGEDDNLNSFSFINGEINATIDLAPNDLFSAEDMAVTRYSQLSDELLYHEGWEVLTVTYVNVGTVSMNRNEKESNEYGDYFPTLKIEERLK
ncbi:hypothetical protein GCM10008967_09450 [Bacillus carboniphilus]|uniref:Lipoprotein n=1 Tax=Bacillus carboniphilus TaxID=86663 RepID=A0ABN0VZK5_9BACI